MKKTVMIISMVMGVLTMNSCTSQTTREDRLAEKMMRFMEHTIEEADEFLVTTADNEEMKEVNYDKILQQIVDQERKELPLVIQKYSDVATDIRIDSIIFTRTEYPFEALLYTTWDLSWNTDRGQRRKETKTVYVKVGSIERDYQNPKTITWHTKWDDAHWDIKWHYIYSR